MPQEKAKCVTSYVCVKLGQTNPFAGPSVENDQPVSYPIKGLDELLQWKADYPYDHGQPFSVASVPHTPKVINEGSTKTLLCHDMKGGYLIDRFVQGLHMKEAYHTRYWNMIDIFVYFSHHFITVPPVSWINSAHRNGVTVLGTFISEGDEGYERCKQIFSSEKSWMKVADQLVEIARFYRFDGWFLNIENMIAANKVSAVVGFIGYLTKNMHALDSNALVIWYDSVTCDGTLQWQNELNKNNECFYGMCDGIFLNYAWNESGLKRSKSLARPGSTVFVGIDVFGRGCYGGGGFNCAMAMDVIKKCDLSAGIFAPGWVFEKYETNYHDQFDEKDEQFWKALQLYCHSYPLDATAGVASRFNPGCYQNEWCFNNSQDLMPLLPSSYLFVVAEERSVEAEEMEEEILKPGGKMVVTIPEDSVVLDELIDIFQIQMVLRGACATLLSPVDCDFHFVLQSDQGIIEPDSSGRRQILPSGDEIKVTTFVVKGTVVVQGLAIKVQEHDLGCNFPIKFLQLLPGLRGEGDFTFTSVPIHCDDVFWEKGNEEAYQSLRENNIVSFIFGGTLVFHDLPTAVASSDVSCQIYSSQESEEVFLGSSYCSRFRVNRLFVPNPVFDGPGCYLLFTVTHLSSSGLRLGESKLKVVYAENIANETRSAA